jgi:hypothetical protein
VALVVVTVAAVLVPKLSFRVSDEPEIEVTVPVRPPPKPPAPPGKRPARRPPVPPAKPPGAPVGTAVGAPLGGVPPKPPARPPEPKPAAEQALVLLMVTVVALIGVVVVVLLAVPPPVGRWPEPLRATATQSPTLRADRVDAEVLVKRVEAAKATFVVPLVVVTFAPSLPVDATVPVTAVKPARDWLVPLPPVVVPPVVLDPLLAPELPQAARTSAAVAIVTTPVRRRRVVRGRDGDTELSRWG